MARPIDPTSQLQVAKRAKRLRSEESGWTQSLAMAMELASLLHERRLHLLLRPAFYKEVAVWMGSC